MLSLFEFIVWTANPEVFSWEWLSWSPRWYGLLFAAGFLISQQILFYIFRKEGHKESDVETLTVFMVLATILGARLGHVFFYEPAKYLSNPIDIFKIWEGGLASHGAAVGILFALFLYSNYDIKYNPLKAEGHFKRQKRPRQSWLWVVDRIVIVVALTGGLIRFGNFMNSEIIGKPTQSDYGVVFGYSLIEALENTQGIESVTIAASDRPDPAPVNPEGPAFSSEESPYRPIDVSITFGEGGYQEAEIRNYLENQVKDVLTRYASIREHIYEPTSTPLNYELNQRRGAYVATIQTFGIPRHPAQLYESGTTFMVFLLLLFLWSRMREKTPEGLFLGLFLIFVFGLRFVHEFFKENQVDWEGDIPLNMGQWLSIPLVLIGLYLLFVVVPKNHRKIKQTVKS
ncbi:prolipoprotein diacylglyceryl transferase [Tunicatimonas pelagia]|uniref:prolipoprotein diacylglyceryl transferase n=1 Tax=Tunicatimonas pelagia TaxID=931531 RepID=UPI002666A9C1|nr:prolipoprotein diacylglyceryl transferase [Tunicatimonas pelagia]WKN42470.1 prolipoprotein diacylglyceryl transferase [Tunicatimonas pelagia]